MPSRGTTNFSNVSIDGTPGQLRASRVSSSGSILANEVWASVLSAPALGATFSNLSASQVSASRITSNVSLLGNAGWFSSLSLGGGQIIGFSTLSVKIPIQVVQPSASSFTVGVWSGLQLGDVIITTVAADDGTASSLSSGLVYHSHVTASGRYEFRYSNVSTLAQTQSAKSFNLVAIRPF